MAKSSSLKSTIAVSLNNYLDAGILFEGFANLADAVVSLVAVNPDNQTVFV